MPRDRKPAKRKKTKKRSSSKVKLTPTQRKEAKSFFAKLRKWRKDAVKRAKKK